MKCIKCDHDLEGDSKFCDNCGEKIVTDNFSNLHFNEIKDHLEFLGYNCELGKAEPERAMMLCKHPTKPNLVLISNKKQSNLIYFSSTWNGLKAIDNIEQYKVLNTANCNSTLAQCTINGDGDSAIYGTYIGEYNKNRFREFIDLFLNDVNRIIKDEQFQKLFSE